MTASAITYLVIFWAMQVIVALFLKYGSTGAGRFWYSFIVANLIGMSSSYFYMLVQRPPMNANIGMGLLMGGAFLLGQLGLAIAFRSSLTPLQCAGVGAMLIGMVCLCFGQNSST